MLLHRDKGFPEKELGGVQWPTAGASPRTPPRAINTVTSGSSAAADRDDGECSVATTPTAKAARIPEQLRCPPAPRKRKPPRRCTLGGGREFFTPPDLETVFMRCPEKAK